MIRCAALAAALALSPFAATAQTVPPGWRERPSANGRRAFDSVSHPNTRVAIMPVERVGLPGMKAQLAALGTCGRPGPVVERPGGVLEMQASTAALRCAIVSAPVAGGYRGVLAMALGDQAMSAPELLTAARAFAGANTPPTERPSPALETAQPVSAARVGSSGQLPQPIGAVLHGRMTMIGFPPMPSYKATAWFLLPGGIATDCAWIDSAAVSLAQLRARKDCTGARWRRTGGRVELQVDDGDAWSADGVHAKPPAPRGFRVDFSGVNKGGAGFESPLGSTNVLTGGGFRLTRAGRIEASTWGGAHFNSSAAFAASQRRRMGLTGTYEIDGYILRVRQDDGSAAERYILLDRESSDGKLYVYFEKRLYWLPG